MSESHDNPNAEIVKGGDETPMSLRGDKLCRITVDDNGIGIDQKDVERIFTVFEKAHIRADLPDDGLELATCRKIVTRHGGVISADGEPGLGAEFTIVLPMTPTDD